MEGGNRVSEVLAEVMELKRQLQDKEVELMNVRSAESDSLNNSPEEKLSNADIARFSRQIIMPEVGMRGQLALKNSSVLIVGAGGLGCPSALYLTGAGVGHIGIVDYDDVEINNLHRQLLHKESSIGKSKVHSAATSLSELHSGVRVTPYRVQLSSHNALAIVKKYDVVLDATDNVATRYLLSDACVLAGRPLVSGSALKLEGQLTVYNYERGPCYRCLYPIPPPPETVTNCGDGGVLGVVPGVIGTLQALETIKIMLNLPGVLSQRLLVFDGSDCTFRNVCLRGRNPDCAACGAQPTITALIDYEQFCGAKANDKDSHVHLLSDQQRISVSEYKDVITQRTPHLLIDVRSEMEFQICRLQDSINFTMDMLKRDDDMERIKRKVTEEAKVDTFPVYVVCRRGNDSQRAVVKLCDTLKDLNISVKDIVGGLHAWTREIDPEFPMY